MTKPATGAGFIVCPRRESNPHSPFGKQDFKSCASTSSATRATDGRHKGKSLQKKIPSTRIYQTRRMEFHRAEDEARTRDLNLGKVALYQLSYFRILP